MINDHVFMPNKGRTLRLNQASEWTLIGDGAFAHPFHIHINPFQVFRIEPDGIQRKVWKDVIAVNEDGTSLKIWSRYTDFRGKFVFHCHILEHEDLGMMEEVEVKD